MAVCIETAFRVEKILPQLGLDPRTIRSIDQCLTH